MAKVIRQAQYVRPGDTVIRPATVATVTLAGDSVAVTYTDGTTTSYGPDDGLTLEVPDTTVPLAADAKLAAEPAATVEKAPAADPGVTPLAPQPAKTTTSTKATKA